MPTSSSRAITASPPCRSLGQTDVAVVLSETEGSTADSAAENVTRKQLSALEEAGAVQAMAR